MSSTFKADQAVERLAATVESGRCGSLREVFLEIHPEQAVPEGLTAHKVAEMIRSGLESEEIVDLWNVVFPEDHNVWYDEINQEFHVNEELVSSPES